MAATGSQDLKPLLLSPNKTKPRLQPGFQHTQNRQEMIMSKEDYNKIRSATLQELPLLPAHLVIEWLQGQHQAIGEAVAKACYQQLARA